MGLVRTMASLENPKRPDLAPVEVEALVATGAVHLRLPTSVAQQLDLEPLELRSVNLADGTTHRVPYSGPVKTVFSGRSCYTGAMVLGDEGLLGAVPMEDMDLVVRPFTQTVTPNPASLNLPASIAKGLPVRRETDV